MSLSIWRGAFGRCTLTATRRPFGSTARCTWPIEAAASGCLVELEEEPLDRLPELLQDHALDVRERERLDVVLQAAQLGDDVRRHDVGPGREQLPELDERRPELVEHLAQVPAAQGRRAGVAVPPAVEHEAEAVADRDLGDLAQPADARGLRPSWPPAKCCTAGACQRGKAAGTPPSTGMTAPVVARERSETGTRPPRRRRAPVTARPSRLREA